MRKLLVLVAALLTATATFAQAPQGFSYQAVVRDAQNAIVANQTVDVTITILQGADVESAKAIFTEKHSAKTNANGLFTLTIGSVDAAGFAKINWGNGSCFLKTESAYGESTTQLMSVPYALYAANAGTVDNATIEQFVSNIDFTTYNLVNKSTLANYAKTSDIPTIPTNVGAFTNDVRYITETDLESRGYLTASETGVNLADYYSKTEVDSKLDDATNKLFTTENGYDFVDLGLPSGTLWATCNVGASRPEEYGGVFAWGETQEKETYTLRNYAFFVEAYGHLALNKYTLYPKYGLQDGRETLESEDDAASTVMGGEWVMPTADQWTELFDNCYFEWTNNYNSTDSAGYIVYKVKTADDKGKFNYPLTESSFAPPQEPTESYSLKDVHIFLPASGSNKNHIGHGSSMQYWASSLFSDVVEDEFDGESIDDYLYAKFVRFSINGKHPNSIISRTRRTQAKSVRGVCVSPSTKVTTSGELKNYYTKSEADDKFALKTNVYTKTEVDALIASLTNQITSLQNALPKTTKVTIKVVYNSTPSMYQSDATEMAWIEAFGQKITGTSTFYVTTGSSVNWKMGYAGGNTSTGFPYSYCMVKVNNEVQTQDNYKIYNYVLNGNSIEYQQTGMVYGYSSIPEANRPKVFKTSTEYSIPVRDADDITIEIDIYTSFYAG